MNKEEIKALVALLDDDDDEVLQAVVKRIQEIGFEVVPFLESAWEQYDGSFVQQKIENLIHELQFKQLIENLRNWKNDESYNLLKGLFFIATYHYPVLDYDFVKHKIDTLIDEAKSTLQFNDQHPYDKIRVLNQFFFITKRFLPNKKNFYSEYNSFINNVLESKKGIPLTLSIIYQYIAQGLGLPVFGVNLPNLFVLTYLPENENENEKQFYINVYNSGLIFTHEDIKSYIKQLDLPHSETFYQPASNIDIVQRCIRNLISSYEHSGEDVKKHEMEKLLEIFQN